MRPRRPGALRALPMPARRPLGLGCTLALVLALATVSASDPVLAEQPAAAAPPVLTSPAADTPAAPGASAPALPVPAATEPAIAAPSPPLGPQPSQVPYEPVAGTVSPAQPAAPAPGAEPGTNAQGGATGTAPTAASPVPATAGTSPARASAQAPAAAPARSLLPLVQPLWSELTPAQRTVLAPLEPQWNTLTKEEKRPWLALAERLPKMKAAERARAEKRIREWAALTPEQRRLARNNYRLAKKLPKEQRVATWEQYQQMTPEQQAVLRQAGWTSNTAARHAGAPTGLAKEAAQPLWRRILNWIWKPEQEQQLANGKPSGGVTR